MPRRPYANPGVETSVVTIERSLQSAYQNTGQYLRDQLARLNRDGQIIRSDRFNVLRIQAVAETLLSQMQRLGFGDVVTSFVQALLTLARSIQRDARGLGVKGEFTGDIGQSVAGLLWGLQRVITGTVEGAEQELEELLVRSVTGARDYSDLIEELQTTLDTSELNARTKAAETIASFHTQVRRTHFEDAGVKWFRYGGPGDGRNRDFCSHFVGTRFTIADLDKHAASFNRKHPLPPSISLGGYNCRHELIPLVSRKAIERYPKGPRKNRLHPKDKV